MTKKYNCDGSLPEERQVRLIDIFPTQSPAPEGTVRISLHRLPQDAITPPGADMENLRLPDGRFLWVKENDREIWLQDEQGGFKIHLNHVQGEGSAYLIEPYLNEAHLDESYLKGDRMWQNVMRVSYFFKFLEHRGLLLHASGLVKDGMAYLFPGVSGSGKTTIVRLSPGLPILSDEMPAVKLEQKNGSGAVAFGTPFYGDLGVPGENISAPLRGLYFPRKAEANRLLAITPGEALARLLPSVVTFTNWKPRLRQVFDLAGELVNRVPAYDLEFSPTPDFWQVIDGS